MTESVTIGNAQLYLGDFREVMSSLPKIDAIVTDPPYGIGWEGHSASKREWEKLQGDDGTLDLHLNLHGLTRKAGMTRSSASYMVVWSMLTLSVVITPRDTIQRKSLSAS